MFIFAILWAGGIIASWALPTGLNYIVAVLFTILFWPVFACFYLAVEWHWDPATVVPLYYFLTVIWLICLGLPFVIRRRGHDCSPA